MMIKVIFRDLSDFTFDLRVKIRDFTFISIELKARNRKLIKITFLKPYIFNDFKGHF
jgi:hypothetical protein